MRTFAAKIDSLLNPLRQVATYGAAPLLDLAFRLYPASVFFQSGLGRFQDFLNDTWGRQLFLFAQEHPVFGLPATIAAPVTTGAELILPILLALGLFGRFAAGGLLVMTMVIEFTYLHSTTHYLWGALLAAILIKGPGLLSVDALLVKWTRSPKG
ncbi:MAG: DoxX family protein [Alphaproteobacteria bacterium]|nr:DoxX family protein [Alphaproteobacteria bacterium]